LSRRSAFPPASRPHCHLAGPALALLALLTACATPQLSEQTPGGETPRLAAQEVIMDDGYRLPLRRWEPEGRPRVLVLAAHGFNDYANAFATLGPYLAGKGVLTYAYDQRGFGATARRGHWAGTGRMIADLRAVARLLRRRHPGLPLYLLGESMGGGLIMAAEADDERVADGALLLAPAVWSRETMNPFQRLVLWAAAHSLPWLELSGSGLDIRPSDNVPMLRALGADPQVIKETRVDALWGVTNLMDRAAASAPALPAPALILYGEHDEIIPKTAFCATLRHLPRGEPALRLVLYRDGWHMLARDLQGERVMADIAAWIAERAAPLPSGEEVRADSPRLAQLCPAAPDS
jgi:alpha-beta hydrolase superfamily lysophospholipase